MSRDAKSIERDARAAQGDLGWLEAHAEQIVNQYVAWSNDGRKGRAYTGDGRGGQELTQPEQVMERALTGKPDEIERQWSELLVELQKAAAAAYRARRLAGNFLHDGTTLARKLAESVGAMSNRAAGEGWCSNCGRFCSGARGKNKTGDVVEDRLKGGLCSSGCYEYFKRTGEHRPKELWPSKKERAADRMSA